MSMMPRQDQPGGLMKLVILGLLIDKITSSIYRLFDPNKLKTSWHDTSANCNTELSDTFIVRPQSFD